MTENDEIFAAEETDEAAGTQPDGEQNHEGSDQDSSEPKRKTASKVGQVLSTIARGEFLFTFKCDKFFPHIVYFFFLICMVLAVNLMIEQTMVKAEQNKAEINELRIVLTHRNAELVSLGKLGKVQEMLKASGSQIGIPDSPATRLE